MIAPTRNNLNGRITRSTDIAHHDHIADDDSDASLVQRTKSAAESFAAKRPAVWLAIGFCAGAATRLALRQLVRR